MVYMDDLKLSTVKTLGKKHIYWLDQQPMSKIMTLVADPTYAEELPALLDYIRVRMGWLKPPEPEDLRILFNLFPFGYKNTEMGLYQNRLSKEFRFLPLKKHDEHSFDYHLIDK